MRIVNVVVTIVLLASPVYATDWYVAINGSDGVSGTLASPFQTIQKAADMAFSGDNVFVRDGTYRAAAVRSLTTRCTTPHESA